MPPNPIAVIDTKALHHVFNKAMGHVKTMGSKFEPRLVQSYVVHRNRSNASWRSYLDIDHIRLHVRHLKSVLLEFSRSLFDIRNQSPQVRGHTWLCES